MTHEIFASEEAGREFARNGFVVLPSLDSDAIQVLRDLHDRLFPVLGTDFYSTTLNATVDQRVAVMTGIRTVLEGPLRAILPRHKLQLATFKTKRPGTKRGRVPLHQD